MGHLMYDGRAVAELADDELGALLVEQHSAVYAIRPSTLGLWVGVVRAFDEIGPPMTVRGVFYALTVRGYVQKAEPGYRQVAYLLLQMRRRGVIPFGFIADNTRWMRKPNTYESLESFLALSRDTYRRALWIEQDAYVEIWIEKDALAGVVSGVTEKWDVPLMVTRGFPSESFVYAAGEHIREVGKPTYLYYFGDHDPSGVCISDNLAVRLSEWAPEAQFERVAVTAGQIAALRLPTRPTKKSDTRARNWSGGSVELDAIPADVLREMVEACITRHIDAGEVARLEAIEVRERETLDAVLAGLNSGQ